MIPRPSSNVLSPTNKKRAPARLQRPKLHTQLAVRGLPKSALCTHSVEQAPLQAGLVMCKVLFVRAPLLGLCFSYFGNQSTTAA